MAKFEELLDNLDEEIARLQEELSLNDPRSDNYKQVAERLKELMEIRMTQQKNEAERSQKEEQIIIERSKYLDEICESKKDRRAGWIRMGIDVLLTAVKVGGTVLGTALMLNQGYDFEKTGSPTSVTFREARKTIGDALKNLTHKK